MNQALTIKRTAFFATVVLIASSIAYALVKHQTHTMTCADNLSRLYLTLEMYEIDKGTLPRLAFFPNDPRQDNDSLCVVLREYGATEDICICPSTHDKHRELGLTYVWNSKLSGQKLEGDGPATWMLVEMNAVSPRVPAPHFGRYNILYTDGEIKRSQTPPEELLK